MTQGPGAPLAHVRTLQVLGVPVRLRSNASELVQAFEASFGAWQVFESFGDQGAGEGASAPVRSSPGVPVEGTLVLEDGSEGGESPVPVRYASTGTGRLRIQTPGSLVESDAARRVFDGRVTRALLAEGERFRYKVLEAAVLSVVTHMDRQPVHGSVVSRGGAALVLAAPSGTGKSTLAYAAARAGLQVLSEDTVFAQLEPRLRLWAMPRAVHLPPDARRHFPELAGVPARTLPTGKQKIAVRLASLGAEAAVPYVDAAGICILERGAGPRVGWEPLDPGSIETRLRAGAEPGFDLFDQGRAELARALSRGGGWLLSLSDDPEAALPLVHRMLDEVEARVGRKASA